MGFKDAWPSKTCMTGQRDSGAPVEGKNKKGRKGIDDEVF